MMTEDEGCEYTKNYLEKVRIESRHPNEKVFTFTGKLLNDIKVQSRAPTKEDIAEMKKWIRLGITFPDKFHRYLPKFKIFYDNYGHMVSNLDDALRYKLLRDVMAELKVEPVNDKDFEFVAKGVIETMKRK